MRIKVDDITRFVFDFPMLGAVLVLLMVSLIMVGSAPLALTDCNFGSPIK